MARISRRAWSHHAKAVGISGACVIASVAYFLFLLPSGSGAFGIAAMILGSLTAVKAIMFAAYIAFVIQGFRVHWGWGTVNIFLGPLTGIAFYIQHRHQGRVPIYVLAHGLILLFAILIFLIVYKGVA